MGGAALIAPIAEAGIGAASSGKGGGGGGGGGISPEQRALAQYSYGQDLLKDRSASANFGTGESTMETQATTGARNQLAKSEAQASDVNQQLQQQAGTQLQQLAQQQQNQSDQASGFGAGAGGFGSSGGSTGNTGSTSTG
jgi:hypothetical protein